MAEDAEVTINSSIRNVSNRIKELGEAIKRTSLRGDTEILDELIKNRSFLIDHLEELLKLVDHQAESGR